MSFGKRYTIFACLVSSVLLYLLAIPTLANEKNYIKVLDDARKEFTVAFTELESKMGECTKEAPVNVLKIKEQLPVIEERQLQHVLVFLEQRSISKCVHDAETNVLFTLSSLELLLESLAKKGVKVNDEYKAISGTRQLLSGIAPEMMFLRADYEALPEDVRSKVESIKELQGGYFRALHLFDKLKSH